LVAALLDHGIERPGELLPRYSLFAYETISRIIQDGNLTDVLKLIDDGLFSRVISILSLSSLSIIAGDASDALITAAVQDAIALDIARHRRKEAPGHQCIQEWGLDRLLPRPGGHSSSRKIWLF
jgi:hypothetical protein